MKILRPTALLTLLLCASACSSPEGQPVAPRDEAPAAAADSPTAPPTEESAPMNDDRPAAATPADAAGKEEPAAAAATREVATFGGGCFWCTEAVLEQLAGVLDVRSGYMGGDVDDPTYQQVCTGTTNHAEVVQVTFDPSVITYEKLLEWFFRSHDPTTLNRQGADVGTQYRSVIFFHSEAQHRTALDLIARIGSNWQDPIVTEVTAAETFWPAEAYHQDYYRNNKSQGYCRVVIMPKLEKLGLDTAPAANRK